MYLLLNFYQNTTEIPNVMGMGHVPKILGENPVLIKTLALLDIYTFCHLFMCTYMY